MVSVWAVRATVYIFSAFWPRSGRQRLAGEGPAAEPAKDPPQSLKARSLSPSSKGMLGSFGTAKAASGTELPGPSW